MEKKFIVMFALFSMLTACASQADLPAEKTVEATQPEVVVVNDFEERKAVTSKFVLELFSKYQDDFCHDNPNSDRSSCFTGSIMDVKIVPNEEGGRARTEDGGRTFISGQIPVPPDEIALDSDEFYKYVEAYFVKEFIKNPQAFAYGCVALFSADDCRLYLDVFSAVSAGEVDDGFRDSLDLSWPYQPDISEYGFEESPYDSCQSINRVMLEITNPLRNIPNIYDWQSIWEESGCSERLELLTWYDAGACESLKSLAERKGSTLNCPSD